MATNRYTYAVSVITEYDYDNMSSGSETFYGYGNIKTIKKGIADESETSHFDFCNFKETTNITYMDPLYDNEWIDRPFFTRCLFMDF